MSLRRGYTWGKTDTGCPEEWGVCLSYERAHIGEALDHVIYSAIAMVGMLPKEDRSRPFYLSSSRLDCLSYNLALHLFSSGNVL